jgi:hypothetical protein
MATQNYFTWGTKEDYELRQANNRARLQAEERVKKQQQLSNIHKKVQQKIRELRKQVSLEEHLFDYNKYYDSAPLDETITHESISALIRNELIPLLHEESKALDRIQFREMTYLQMETIKYLMVLKDAVPLALNSSLVEVVASASHRIHLVRYIDALVCMEPCDSLEDCSKHYHSFEFGFLSHLFPSKVCPFCAYTLEHHPSGSHRHSKYHQLW